MTSPDPLRPNLLAWTAGLLLTLLVPGTLLANGGTLRLSNVQMGEYRVSVFTDPTPVRPDSLDVSVLIFDPEEGGVPDGVQVFITTELMEIRDRETAPPAVAVGMGETLQATREQADDPRYYAVKFGLGGEGRWKITVEVDGPAGQGEASFEVTAQERGILGHPLTITLLALLPLALAAWWVLREDPEEEDRDEEEGEVASPSPG